MSDAVWPHEHRGNSVAKGYLHVPMSRRPLRTSNPPHEPIDVLHSPLPVANRGVYPPAHALPPLRIPKPRQWYPTQTTATIALPPRLWRLGSERWLAPPADSGARQEFCAWPGRRTHQWRAEQYRVTLHTPLAPTAQRMGIDQRRLQNGWRLAENHGVVFRYKDVVHPEIMTPSTAEP